MWSVLVGVGIGQTNRAILQRVAFGSNASVADHASHVEAVPRLRSPVEEHQDARGRMRRVARKGANTRDPAKVVRMVEVLNGLPACDALCLLAAC